MRILSVGTNMYTFSESPFKCLFNKINFYEFDTIESLSS